MNQQDVVKMKRKNKKKAKKIIMLIFLVLIALGLLFTLSVTVFFPVKSVEIEGNSYYTSEEIKKAVDINKKDNLLIINKEKVLNDLQKQLPFVDDIKINKKLPGAVKITVTEAK
jgi:cell division protein FtsQ